MAIDDLPEGYVLQSQGNNPSELPDGYVLQGQNDSSNSNDISGYNRSGNLGAADIARGAIGVAPRILDSGTHVVPFLYNLLRPSSWPKSDYPPSANEAIQGLLTKAGLPTPQTPTEQVTSSAIQNWPFGIPGMLAGGLGSAIQQSPISDTNINIGGRDIGLSPKDLLAGGTSMLAQGALSPKPLMMRGVAESEAGRVAQMSMDKNIPVYASDVAPSNSIIGSGLNFLNSSPFSGKMGRGEAQSAALTKNAVSDIGESGDELTPQVMKSADARIGKVYEDFGKSYDVTPQAGNGLIDRISDIQAAWPKLAADTQRRLETQVNSSILNRMNKDYSIDGSMWSNIQKELGADARSTNDTEYSGELYKLQGAVRNSMRQSIAPDDWSKFDTANQQYRAMLALEPAAKKAISTGIVDPQSLMQGVNKIYPNTVYDDPNALPQLAQSGQLLKNAQQYSNKYQNEQWKTPYELGKAASYAATPLSVILNRGMNTRLTPMDFSNPYGAGLYRGMLGGASVPFSLAPQTGGQ